MVGFLMGLDDGDGDDVMRWENTCTRCQSDGGLFVLLGR